MFREASADSFYLLRVYKNKQLQRDISSQVKDEE